MPAFRATPPRRGIRECTLFFPYQQCLRQGRDIVLLASDAAPRSASSHSPDKSGPVERVPAVDPAWPAPANSVAANSPFYGTLVLQTVSGTPKTSARKRPVSQEVYPGEALVIELVVAGLPYLVIRGPAARIARRW